MVRRANWLKLITFLLLTIVASCILLKKGIIDIENIHLQGYDFHYNAISTSAVIGGFLFTGISILISAISNERIKRLWDHNYLDNLYRAAFVGMIANVTTIILALALISCKVSPQIETWLIWIEFVTIAIGIVFFAWCIRLLTFIISRLKKKKPRKNPK